MKKIILVVDIETTGFLNQGGKIVEIGIVKLDLDTGSIVPAFSSLIKERGFDDSHTKGKFGWIFKNSDLTFDEANHAPNLESQHEILQGLFNEFRATAYNKEFDFGFLSDRGFEIKELPCPMLLATPILNLPSTSGFGSPKWPKVEEAWEYFFGNTGYIESHRGLDDAKHEAKIVYELYKLGKFSPEFSETVYNPPIYSLEILMSNLDKSIDERNLISKNNLAKVLNNPELDNEEAFDIIKTLARKYKSFFKMHLEKYISNPTLKIQFDLREDYFPNYYTIYDFLKEDYKTNYKEYDELKEFDFSKYSYVTDYWNNIGKRLVGKYINEIEWWRFCYKINSKFPWTEDFISEYEDSIDFKEFSQVTNFNWTEDFISKYKDRLDFELLSGNESLPWSVELYSKYIDKWYKFSREMFGDLSEIRLDLNSKLPWNKISFDDFKEISGQNFDQLIISPYLYANKGINWDSYLLKKYPPDFNNIFTKNVCCHRGVFWTKELIEFYKNEIDWMYLSSNNSINWDSKLLTEFWNDWVWYEENKVLVTDYETPIYNSEYYGLIFNEKLPWSLKLIWNYESKINWKHFCNNLTVWKKCFIPYLNESNIEEIFSIIE